MQASKTQIGMIDQLMAAWQAQVKSPSRTAALPDRHTRGTARRTDREHEADTFAVEIRFTKPPANPFGKRPPVQLELDTG